MAAALLPQWLSESALFVWLAGPGYAVIVLGNHAQAALIAVLACVQTRRVLGAGSALPKLALLAMLTAQAVWFMGTLFLLDGGQTLYYGSGLWAAFALAFAALMWVVRVQVRHSRPSRNGLPHAQPKPS